MKIKTEEEYFVNPYVAIRIFAKTYLKVGDKITTDRKYKLTREAWIASMFLIALSNHTKVDWWLTPVLDNSGSPDFICVTFFMSKSKSGAVKQRMKLEVFEWRKSNPEDELISALQRIKLNKIIDPELTLLCYIKNRSTIPPATTLNSQLLKINPKVKDIWYLGDVSLDAKTWRVTQIYPKLLAIDIDYEDILVMKVKHGFIRAHRASSNSLGFERTNQKILLTPEFEMELLEM